MATKKPIWIIFGILIIAALLLGFATSAGAHTYNLLPLQVYKLF